MKTHAQSWNTCQLAPFSVLEEVNSSFPPPVPQGCLFTFAYLRDVSQHVCRGLSATCPSIMWVGPGIEPQLQGWMACTFTQWNHLTGPVSQFCFPFHLYMTNSEVIQLFPPVPWANQYFRVKWYIHVVLIFLTRLHDKHAAVFIVFYHIYAKAVMKFCIVSEHGNLVKGEG